MTQTVGEKVSEDNKKKVDGAKYFKKSQFYSSPTFANKRSAELTAVAIKISDILYEHSVTISELRCIKDICESYLCLRPWELSSYHGSYTDEIEEDGE